jgi:hypothetical protein
VAIDLKYILIIFLFFGFANSEVYGSVAGVAPEETVILTDSDIPGWNESFEDVNLPLFYDAGMINDDNHSFKTKTFAYLLLNKSYKGKILNGLYVIHTVTDNYIHPLRYYIYTLEKIVI